ncbi:hypothetical protein TNCV_246791 [Trichonephila clavipes]|nr:hypothetical protein TNCV_246791 [Trichonephila clavipes]
MHSKRQCTKDLPAAKFVARWALMLGKEFDYEVCHRSGRQMKHDDALSRLPHYDDFLPMILLHKRLKKQLQNKDEFISQLKSAIKITPSDEYSLKTKFCTDYNAIMNSTTT